MIAVEFFAGHDKNGNARRLYVVFDDEAQAVAIVKSGVRGRGALDEAGFEGIPVTVTFETTPRWYRVLLKKGYTRGRDFKPVPIHED